MDEAENISELEVQKSELQQPGVPTLNHKCALLESALKAFLKSTDIALSSVVTGCPSWEK